MIGHCPRCGAASTKAPPTVCETCGYAQYVNPRPTGTAIILDGDTFLIIRRARAPRSGMWELPGGFCDGWEHPSDAAIREAREELGVEIRLSDFVGMFVGTYDFQDEHVPVLDCFWTATIRSGTITLDPAEATEFAWADPGNPPTLAFETMDAAISEVRIRRMAACLAG